MNSSDELLQEKIVSVAIPRPLPGFFTYRISSEWASQVKIGSWVKVPFGRSVTHAFIVELPKSMDQIPPGLSFQQIKQVIEVSDPELALTEEVFQVCKWAHEYYFSPLGEVLNCAAPAATVGIKKFKRMPKKISAPNHAKVNIQLTPDQVSAVDILTECDLSSKKRIVLLEGVTGSGKTEVYIEFAKKILSQGRGVLILVPEIALTPALHYRIESGLGRPVALWHSALSASKRRDHCLALKRGEVLAVLGARSAVFAPIEKLGLIVVDEEHDPAYKQEDRVRYQARDLAIVRAKLAGALTILGSATPSLESRERVREGRYAIAEIRKRVSAGGLPEIDLVDLKIEKKIEKIQAPLAVRTLDAIQNEIASGGQVIVYLNRRGFAAFLLCKDCGEVIRCPHCSVSLSVHKSANQLKCHQCGYSERIIDECPKCHSSQVFAMGAGTESLESELPPLLQDAKVIRLDRDQITSATRLNDILEEFQEGRANILLGTQMLVKGHDFPGVTLVVVILADALFKWPDFRASERAYQILRQVSGRAGRRDVRGKVLIQTYDPKHIVLQTLLGNIDEKTFLESERELRQALEYPPFSRLARLRLESSNREEVIQRSKEVAHQLASISGENDRLIILGPSEAFLEKVRGIYRWDLLLKAKNIQILQKGIFLARDLCLKKRWQLTIDVDPYGM